MASPMEHSAEREVRAAFAASCGPDEYARFVLELNTFGVRQSRMRYWQEVLWDRFAKSGEGLVFSFEQLQSIFRLCVLHGCDLAMRTPAIAARELEYEAALEHPDGPSRRRMVHAAGPWYCPACWSEFETWERTHPFTLDGFVAEGQFSKMKIATSGDGNPAGSDWEEYADRTRPGDELWLLRSPEDTWRQLCGREFLTLVREGRIVAMRLTAMS